MAAHGTLEILLDESRLYVPWDECAIYLETKDFVFEGDVIITSTSIDGENLIIAYQATSQNKRGAMGC